MYTLGKLIKDLERCPPDEGVYFDFCGAFPLLSIDSSRCHYERAAIDWTANRKSDYSERTHRPTVAELLAFLKASIGKPIHGYKGGDYIISADLPLHVDGHGECTSTVVCGVRCEWAVTLETENV